MDAKAGDLIFFTFVCKVCWSTGKIVLECKRRIFFSVSKGLMLYIFFLILLLSACGEQEGLLPGEGGQYAVQSIKSGSVVLAGESLSVGFEMVEGRADRLDVRLLDVSGRIWERARFAFTENRAFQGKQNMKGFLKIPENLPEGSYSLDFEIRDNDIVLHNEKRFFFVSSGPFDVEGLETFPSGIHPGYQVRAVARFSFPEDSEPWILWTLNDKILQEGPVFKWGQTCRFAVPRREGIYALKAELFPVKPEPGQFSLVRAESDLFVRIHVPGEGMPPREDRKYSCYVEFAENERNQCFPERRPLRIGTPSLWEVEDLKGLAMKKRDGLFYDFPRKGDGDASPGNTFSSDFVLSLAFSHEALPGDGIWSILSARGKDADFSLFYDGALDAFVCEISGAEGSFSSLLPTEKLRGKDVLSLDVSFRRDGQRASLSWQSLGELLGRDEGLPLFKGLPEGLQIGSDGRTMALPLVWHHLSMAFIPERKEGHFRKIEIYKKGFTLPEVIKSGSILKGKDKTFLDVVLEPGAPVSWVLEIKKEDGSVLYAGSPSGKSLEPRGGKIVWRLPLLFKKEGAVMPPAFGRPVEPFRGIQRPEELFSIEIWPVNSRENLGGIFGVDLIREDEEKE